MNKCAFIFMFLILFTHFALSQCSSDQVNINTAPISDLDKLTGIGPAYAQDIINARPYSSLDDLDRAKNIGPSRLDKIKQQGLACVSSEDQSQPQTNTQEDVQNTEIEDNTDDADSVITSNAVAPIEEVEINQETQPNENIINLNSDNNIIKEEIVYESKNEIIRKYAIYAFAIFLVLIIIILLIKR